MRKLLHPTLALCLLVTMSGLAGWEDETTSPAQAPAPVASAVANKPVTSAASGTIPVDLYSQFLDAPVDPAYWLTLGYFSGGEIDVPHGGDVADIELDAFWDIAFFRDVLAGDIDFKLRMHNVFFTDDGDIDGMPDFLLGLALDAGWTWRFLDGGSLETRLRPGIYSSLDALGGGMFGCPIRLAYYRVLNAEAAFMVGGEFRPGWDFLFMPYLGLAWQPVDLFRLEFAVPRTRAYLYLWRLTFFGGFEWRNVSYAMKGGNRPDQVTLDDILMSAGARVSLTDELCLGFEVGSSLSRSIDFEMSDHDADFDIDPSTFVRIFVGGPF
ncbi:MAG: hypothetical protein ACOX5G_06410 [Kiritimatiellia bacterium]|jgi:hypothetical protein